MHDRELPGLTHLGFLVVGILLSGEQAGRDVRHTLEAYGIRRTAPAFYQMMARFERDGLLEGWYGQVRVGDQAVTERRYRVTTAGRQAWEHSYAFYADIRARATHRRWSRA